jgi:hypothetical protein
VLPKLIAVVAVALCGVTVWGLKLQEYPDGSPEQAKETAELKPFVGVTVRVVFAAAVPLAAPFPGESEMAKSAAGGGAVVTVTVTTGEVELA